MGGASLILLKWAAPLSIPQAERAWGLILFPCLPRWAMVMAITLFPYARSQGLGTAFQDGSRAVPLAFGGLTAVTAAVLIALVGLASTSLIEPLSQMLQD